MKLDLKELRNLFELAKRKRVKDVLAMEIRKLEAEYMKFSSESINATAPTSTSSSTGKCYEVKIEHYGWCQTPTEVKIYVDLAGVHNLSAENIIYKCTETSVELNVKGLNNRNYTLPITNLYAKINPDNSSFIVKNNSICIVLKKVVNEQWSHVTLVEKKLKEAKTPTVPEMGEDADPGAGLMNLMKKMYQDGDDELKKTIAKAWTESQEKNLTGLL